MGCDSRDIRHILARYHYYNNPLLFPQSITPSDMF